MDVVQINNRYFWEGTEEEVFPFPPAGSRKAKVSDFAYTNERNIRLFLLGVEFWAVMKNGYFYKFKTTPNTNKRQLSDDIKAGKIFIAPKKQLVIE